MAWSTVGGGGGGGGTGDVTGPGSSVNNNFVFFNGTTGKIIKDSGLALDTDVNLAANSDLKVPSQKAVKAYVDALPVGGDVVGPNSVTVTAIAWFDSGTGKSIDGASNFVWDGANSYLGVGVGTPGQRIHLYDGNMLLESPAEAAYMVKFEGDLNGNANITNPIWSLGRLVEGGVVDHSVFRFLFSSDDVAERSVFEVEDTGTAASVSDGTRRSHFEAFLNNGDTEPIFRASSAVGAGPEMGFQFGPGGVTPVDVELYRNNTGPGLILGLGGSIKVFWYPDAVVHQPGVNLVLQNTTGSTPELRFQEDDTNGSNYVGFKAPASVANNEVWELPNADGTAGQVLQTNGSNVLSWATVGGGSGGSNGVADGRLTLTSGTPVLTSDVTAATTLYYTPYTGNKISLYNGSAWAAIDFVETSLSLSGYAADTNFDIWGYNNAGTLALESTAWTNDTTRATAITRQNGVWVKSGDATRRLLGTIRTTATIGQTEMTFGGASGGGTPANFFVCNAQNNAWHRGVSEPTSSSWSYSTNSWREIQGGSSVRTNFVSCGLDHEWAKGEYCCEVQAGGAGSVGVGFNNTPPYGSRLYGANNQYIPLIGTAYGKPIAGLNFLAGVENGNGGSTFYGNDANQTGTGLRTEVFI